MLAAVFVIYCVACACTAALFHLQYNDICWTGAPEKWEDFSNIFPSGNITFAGGGWLVG